MIELISIISQIIFITVLISLPNKLTYFNDNKNIYLVISVIYLSFVLLLISFLDINFKYIRFILYGIFFINLIFMWREKKYLYFFNYNFLFFFLIVFTLSLNLAVDLRLGWDAQNYWIIKSLNFINGGNVFDLQNHARPDYPYFGSYLWGVFSSTSLLQHEYFGRIFYIYLFVISIFSITSFVQVSNHYKIIIFILLVIIFKNNYIFNGYQEALVFSYATILSCFIIQFHKNIYEKKNIFLTAMTFFIIFWLKNEALIFSTIFFISIAFFNMNKRFIFFGFLFVLLILLRILLYKTFGLENNFQSGNYENFLITDLDKYITLDRFLLIIKHSIIALFKIPVIIIMIISVLSIKHYKKDILNKIVLLNFVLGMFFIFNAYLFSNFPLNFHLSTSIDRIFIQFSGFNISLIVLLINYLKLKQLTK